MRGRKFSRVGWILVALLIVTLPMFLLLWHSPSQGLSEEPAGQTSLRLRTSAAHQQRTPPRQTAVSAAEPVFESPDEENSPAADRNPVSIHAASLRGVRPGETTLAQLEAAWGQAIQETRHENGLERVYQLEGLPPLIVEIDAQGIVSALVMPLAEAISPEQVSAIVELGDLTPTSVIDEQRRAVGHVYPERGVLLSLDPTAPRPRVTQVILESIGSDLFSLRAEQTWRKSPQAALRDAAQAQQLAPAEAPPAWIKARILTSIGQHERALAACRDAIRILPAQHKYRLTEARILQAMGHQRQSYDAAAEVAERAPLHSPERAAAFLLLGDISRAVAAPEDRHAVRFHLQAIDAARAALNSAPPVEQLDIYETLVAAHTGLALDVARGAWKNKEVATEQWLARANELVRRNRSESHDELSLLVGRTGLEAAAALHGKLPIDPWLQQTVASGNVLLSETSDPWRQRELRWQLGSALACAVEAWQDAGDVQSATRYGKLALQQMESGARGREQQASYRLALADLYYQMGGVQAVGFSDHQQALLWYEKALPLLDRDMISEDKKAQARHGRQLVSMGVSYWEQGRRDQAYQLIQQGTTWLEQAVEAGRLPKSALAVPYENLAAIHQHRGEAEQSQRYAKAAQQPREDAKAAQPVSFRR